MNRLIALATLAATLAMPGTASAQLAPSREDQTMQAAAGVLNEIMTIPVTRIPQWMLADARGVAIVPNVLKGGFVVGVRHGRGVVLVRDQEGGWQPPQFVSLTGGSLGWQAGVQATDVVLVFKTEQSVQNLMRGKFTLGVDAAAAAGPVGREAAAATDATLKAEIYSYSRSRGLFAGVSLDGSALQMDTEANQAYYRAVPGITSATPQIPASAIKLMNLLAQYTADSRATPAVGVTTVVGQPTPALPNAESLKTPLADASRQLSQLVDDTWRRYLALPAEIYSPMAQPSQEALNTVLQRYDRIPQDPRYKALAERPEFRTTHDLLKRYQQSLAPVSNGLPSLPPPPLE